MDQILKKVSQHASSLGLENFVLAVKRGKLMTFHFQNMRISDAMEMAIAFFHHVINIELEKHPEYSKEYRQLYLDLAKDFDALVKKYNGKFLTFRDRRVK